MLVQLLPSEHATYINQMVLAMEAGGASPDAVALSNAILTGCAMLSVSLERCFDETGETGTVAMELRNLASTLYDIHQERADA